jgi:hypothetical protein
MGLKQQLRYFEKQHLRPFFRRIGGATSKDGGRSPVPTHLQTRLESLEARVAELEQLIQEDLGLRLNRIGTSSREPDGKA